MSIKELVEILEKTPFSLRPFLFFEDAVVGDDHIHYNKMVEELIGIQTKGKNKKKKIKELLDKHMQTKTEGEIDFDVNELSNEIKSRNTSGKSRSFPAYYQNYGEVDFQLLGAKFLDITKGKGKKIFKDNDIVFYIVVGKESLSELIKSEQLKEFKKTYREKEVIILYITFSNALGYQKNIVKFDGGPVFTFVYEHTGKRLEQSTLTYENLYRLNEVMYEK